MRTSFLIIITAISIQEMCTSQVNKWPSWIEQISTCTPAPPLDTLASNYRHTIDGYTDKVTVTQGDSIGLYIGTKENSLSGTIDTITLYRYSQNGWTLISTVGTHTLAYYPFHYVGGQPTDYKNGAQWGKTISVTINPTWQSGFYSAQMTAKKNGVTYH